MFDPTGEFGVAGFAVGFGVDVALQWAEGGCFSVTRALISGGLGAVGAPAWVRFGSRGLKRGMTRSHPAFPRGIERIERSKFWPDRWGGTYNKYNYNLRWGLDHALDDASRFRFMRKWWKREGNSPRNPLHQFWNRLPYWTKGATIPPAIGSMAIGQSNGGCACD